MAFARVEYFKELLNDCLDALHGMGIPEDQYAIVIFALIHSDSINGLRKALLQAGSQS